VRVQNAQNLVKSFGYFGDGQHQGGLIGGPIGQATDLTAMFHGHGGARSTPVNLLAMLGLGADAVHAFGGNALAAITAGGYAARPLMRGFDVITGTHNPTGEFMQRFGGRNFTPPTNAAPGAPNTPPNGPSFTNDQFNAAKATNDAMNAAEARKFSNDYLNATSRNDAMNKAEALAKAKVKTGKPSKGPTQVDGSMGSYTGSVTTDNMPGLNMAAPSGYQAPGYASPIAAAKARAKMAPDRPEAAPTATSATQAQANGTGAEKASEAQQSATQQTANPLFGVKARLKLKDMAPFVPPSKADIDRIFAEAHEMGLKGNYSSQPPMPNGQRPSSGIASEAIRKAYGQPAGDHEMPRFEKSDDGMIHVYHRGLEVHRPYVNSMGGPVENEERYISEITNHLGIRANMADELKGAGIKGVDGLMKRLNDRSMTEEAAHHELRHFVDQVQQDKVAKTRKEAVSSIINKHLSNVLSTYDY
jgi:hypothetical protein